MAKTKLGHKIHRGIHKARKEIKQDANKVGNKLEHKFEKAGKKIYKGLHGAGIDNLGANIVGYAKRAVKHPKQFEKDVVDHATHPLRTVEGAVQHAVKRAIEGKKIAPDRYNKISEKKKKLARKAYKEAKEQKRLQNIKKKRSKKEQRQMTASMGR